MNANSPSPLIFAPGRNCWRVTQATDVSFVVDGAAYFAAFRETVCEARHSVFILAWDIDSRLQLTPGMPGRTGSETLADFLHRTVTERPELEMYILSWDFAMIYAFEREWFARYRRHWTSHPRMHVQLDGRHPLGACHHQKVVVVDDAVAFVGGLDLTKCRWDTPEHRPNDPLRRDSNGERYPPFHDVQMIVSGETAAALGQLARERWHRATGEKPAVPEQRRNAVPWPKSVRAVLQHVSVAIARTEPSYDDRPEIRDVEQLYVDAISAARHSIYIETQYLTSGTMHDALLASLHNPTGPQILLVMHLKSDGWLEQHTMDVLRARVLASLRKADRYGRLGVYYPHVAGLGRRSMSVHSKILVVDDTLVRVGTANLSNRSMGFDTECDLAVEAGDEDHIRKAIAAFRNGLLAEHLGLKPKRLAAMLEREGGSLTALIHRLQRSGRTLRPLKCRIDPRVDSWVPDAELIDPFQPHGARTAI